MGVSCAVWPEKQDFLTAHRLQRFLARQRHATPILDWTESFARETLRESDPATFLTDLETIEGEDAFAVPMREDAKRARKQIQGEIWQPRHYFQHGDL